MSDFEDDPLIAAARQQLQSLNNAGHDAWDAAQYLRAGEFYRRALDVATSLGDTAEIVKFRHWYGESLVKAGRLREALAVLVPALQEEQAMSAADPGDVYNALMVYIAIAQALPVGLAAIEKAHTHTEQFLARSGHTAWRHELIYARAELYSDRGLHYEALRAAQEAWVLWKDEYPNLYADSHLSQLVAYSLELRDTALARRYLGEWERLHSKRPSVRENGLSIMHSELARLEGKQHEAVDWARRAVLAAEQIEGASYREDAYETLTYAFLCQGMCQRAREALEQVMGARSSESEFARYSLHLLRGDYQLACARQAAGMPPADDQYGEVFPPPKQIADVATTRLTVARARRSYASALRIGREIDRKLECHIRQDEIACRLARIEDIRC
jgi:tetratricopeptide (TPR) repeat protein